MAEQDFPKRFGSQSQTFWTFVAGPVGAPLRILGGVGRARVRNPLPGHAFGADRTIRRTDGATVSSIQWQLILSSMARSIGPLRHPEHRTEKWIHFSVRCANKAWSGGPDISGRPPLWAAYRELIDKEALRPGRIDAVVTVPPNFPRFPVVAFQSQPDEDETGAAVRLGRAGVSPVVFVCCRPAGDGPRR